jgi:hypothetical protein
MSNVTPLFTDEIQAWDRYAAAALGSTARTAGSAEEAARAAATLADELLRERQKRIKAMNEQLFQH